MQVALSEGVEVLIRHPKRPRLDEQNECHSSDDALMSDEEDDPDSDEELEAAFLSFSTRSPHPSNVHL